MRHFNDKIHKRCCKSRCLFTFDIKITSSFFLAASATANSADCQARPMTDIEMENGWQAMCLAMDLDKNEANFSFSPFTSTRKKSIKRKILVISVAFVKSPTILPIRIQALVQMTIKQLFGSEIKNLVAISTSLIRSSDAVTAKFTRGGKRGEGTRE